MPMRLLFALLVAAVATGCAHASPSAENAVLCNHHHATLTTVQTVAHAPSAWVGRCVEIAAVTRAWYLADNVDGFYLRPADPIAPSSNGAILGLDTSGLAASQHLDFSQRQYLDADVVGRVQDCASVRQMIESNAQILTMVDGYCHVNNGAYLWVTHLRVGPGHALLRQLPAAARDDYGDLQPASANWAYRDAVQSLAERFVAAVRAQDRSALEQLHGFDIDDPYLKEKAVRAIDYILAAGPSPFSALRANSSSQIAIFTERGDQDELYAAACVCTTSDCSARWPIAWIDIDNLPTRPYACFKVLQFADWNRGLRIIIETPVERYGLTEPP